MRQALATLAVAAIGLLGAQAALADGGPPPGQVTANTCKNFAANNPTSFNNIFGSDSACQSALTSAAQSAIASCGTPGTDAFKSCIGTAMNNAIKAIGAAKKNDGLNQAASKATQNACESAAKNNKNFKQVIGTVDNCVSKLIGAAQGFAQTCGADNAPSTDAFKSCMGNKIKAAIKNYKKS